MEQMIAGLGFPIASCLGLAMYVKRQNEQIREDAKEDKEVLMMEIIYKTRDFVVISKPAGIASQSDTSGDEDAMLLTARLLSDMGEPSDLWLVHRLDRVVGGLLVYARNKSAAASLSALASGVGMEKEYIAVVEGRAEGGEMRDFLFKDSKKGKAFVVNTERRGAKEALLEYTVIDRLDGQTLLSVELFTGRTHQIRVQFASRGYPLCGDRRYGAPAEYGNSLCLCAVELSFPHPATGEMMEFKILPLF